MLVIRFFSILLLAVGMSGCSKAPNLAELKKLYWANRSQLDDLAVAARCSSARVVPLTVEGLSQCTDMSNERASSALRAVEAVRVKRIERGVGDCLYIEVQDVGIVSWKRSSRGLFNCGAVPASATVVSVIPDQHPNHVFYLIPLEKGWYIFRST